MVRSDIMKKEYSSPVVSIIVIEEEDVIMLSGVSVSSVAQTEIDTFSIDL